MTTSGGKCHITYHGNGAVFHGILGDSLNPLEKIAKEKNSHHVASLGGDHGDGCPILGENYLASLSMYG